MPVPYRLETPRLVIRHYNPTDATLLKQAIDESLEHLKPWMPWAQNDPEPLVVKAQQLRVFRAHFDLDTDYTFGIFNADESLLLGGTGLHKRGVKDTLEIGYWIHQNAVGKGYVTETVRALCYVGFHYHGAKHLEIRCDPRNHTSYAVAERCGFTLEETLTDYDKTPQGTVRSTMIWRLHRQPLTLPYELRVFDAANVQV